MHFACPCGPVVWSPLFGNPLLPQFPYAVKGRGADLHRPETEPSFEAVEVVICLHFSECASRKTDIRCSLLCLSSHAYLLVVVQSPDCLCGRRFIDQKRTPCLSTASALPCCGRLLHVSQPVLEFLSFWAISIAAMLASISPLWPTKSPLALLPHSAVLRPAKFASGAQDFNSVFSLLQGGILLSTRSRLPAR